MSELAATDLSALKLQQKLSLQSCEQRIKHWTSFVDEYNSLNEKLRTVVETTRHSVMIPVVHSSSKKPPIALVSAYLHHTNEILVLLGDNWFVERSSTEAMNIVNRRLKQCQLMLDRLKEEKKQVESWISWTTNVMEEKTDFVEIVEEFDEAEECKWREKHKENVKQYKMKQAELRKNSSTDYVNNICSAKSGDENLLEEENLGEKLTRPIKPILKKTQTESSEQWSEACKDDVTTDATTKSVMFDENHRNDKLDKRFESPFSGEILERTQSECLREKQRSTPSAIVSKFKKERRK